MKRRTFVRDAAAGALAAGLVSRFDLARAASEEPRTPGTDKLDRIAVTTWSLHAFFPQTKEAGLDVKLAGTGEREYRGKHGYPCAVDGRVADFPAEGLAGLVAPGG